MAKPREGGPTVENRWWVDTGKTTEPAEVVPRGERPPVGTRFFDIGYEFDQEQAKQRLTDLNLKFLDEGKPAPNEWRLIRMVPTESVPTGQVERIKRRLPLPPGARGVIVDSGRSVRFIITGDPIGERVLEFTLGEESSFDCWIRGDWVREELFRDLEDALRNARTFIGRYLGPQPQADNETRA
jgi:hypothetical protein